MTRGGSITILCPGSKPCSSPMIRSVILISSATSARNAVSPCTRVSSMAMARIPKTGLPQALASTCAMPNPSRREGAA